MSALSSAGVTTAIPVTVGRGKRLVFRLWRPGDALQLGELKIPEPLPEAPEVEPDFLFVPLTCFDRRGHRIGFGAGHYDRTLEYLRARRPTFAVGVAFACAEVPEVPIGGHDQALDLIITERETIDCGKV